MGFIVFGISDCFCFPLRGEGLMDTLDPRSALQQDFLATDTAGVKL